MLWLTAAALIVWIIVVLLPWRPCATAVALESKGQLVDADLSGITVLIPARNEATVIKRTLLNLASQGKDLRVILVDDNSTDDTVEQARSLRLNNLVIIAGKALPSEWTGKLWALEQGRALIQTDLTLLLDADVALQPGTLATLRDKIDADGVQFISLMVHLRMQSFWEKLLLPAFVYFFELLYPFRLANSNATRIAAAAGGCILLKTHLLQDIGGFTALKNALIDDCSLAQKAKSIGARTWIGLTRSAQSLRVYDDLAPIWNMVSRTAFTQLRCSISLLLLCTSMMLITFLVPVIGLFYSGWASLFAAATLAIMIGTYLPILRYYRLAPGWALSLPLIGMLYLAMTWTSALRHLYGAGFRWKGRTY